MAESLNQQKFISTYNGKRNNKNVFKNNTQVKHNYLNKTFLIIDYLVWDLQWLK